ncbi:type I phosphomannose isomerase catalytic subunit [uncultured Duncaniella sp.]|jgi:mannose-6-phosphate isomerase|uniref:type I phosphomannose isomerase catalytic subunit n=1 Tax=uncultured Duncaniella sp. TaxID=2768039 RepID=UPI000F49990F|nr:type I phosphomannose isomerase catalytic subunit [uncultured Duncaniella sp.]ROS89113.1 mannose-6-phosphate isomerase [Muribaculaceae bacterium Isolate-080 (Janvier)]
MFTQVLHFAPYLKSVIWGGERIAPFKGIATDQTYIGESWEISAVPGHVSVVDRGPLKGKNLTELINEYGAELVGEAIYRQFGVNFPLLIKLIDACDDLSVQVHPDDALAQKRHHCPGKTEMWHVINTAPGAKIYVGLKEKTTPEDYERRVADNSIMDVIAAYDSAPGDTFFLPAGRIHAIGAGNLLAEIQETSDITYRIYDYDRRDKDGNPRQLHTAEARDAIDYTVYPDYRSNPEGSLLADCNYFIVDNIKSKDSEIIELPHTRESFTIVMCLDGEAEISSSTDNNDSDRQTLNIKRGETLLFPATLRSITVTSKANLLSIQA